MNGNSLVHAPYSTGKYWTLYVLETAYTWRMQIATDGIRLFFRSRQNEDSDWTSWIKYAQGVTPSITAGTASVLPTLSCSGGVCNINFALRLPAGTYYTGLWTVYPRPLNATHFLCSLGGNTTVLRVNVGGTIDMNNSITLTEDTYLIGNVSYVIN